MTLSPRGALAGVVAAAAAGAGASSAVGAGLAGLIGKEHAEPLRRRIEEGDMLPSVRVSNEKAEKRADEFLLKHTSEELNSLELSRSDAHS